MILSNHGDHWTDHFFLLMLCYCFIDLAVCSFQWYIILLMWKLDFLKNTCLIYTSTTVAVQKEMLLPITKVLLCFQLRGTHFFSIFKLLHSHIIRIVASKTIAKTRNIKLDGNPTFRPFIFQFSIGWHHLRELLENDFAGSRRFLHQVWLYWDYCFL